MNKDEIIQRLVNEVVKQHEKLNLCEDAISCFVGVLDEHELDDKMPSELDEIQFERQQDTEEYLFNLLPEYKIVGEKGQYFIVNELA